MKAIVGAAFLVALANGQVAAALPANLCVQRQEDNGSINIYPVDLIVGGRNVATLIGGTHFCVSEGASAVTISLRWHAFNWNRSDHGLRNPDMRNSAKKVVAMPADGSIKSVMVCSARVQGGTPKWRIVTRPAGCLPQ